MAKKPTVSIYVTLRDQPALEALKVLSQRFTKFSAEVAPAIYVVKNGVAALTAVIGLAATALTAATAEAVSFDRSLRAVRTIADESVMPMGKVRDISYEMAALYGTKVTENTKALYEILSAGVTDSAQALEVMHASQQLAIGGLTDTKTAVNGLTSVLNAFSAQGVKSKDVVDSMFVAIRDGKNTAEELSHSIGMLAPTAAAAGLTIEEMFAAMASLTQAGIPTSTALEYIRSALTNVLKPSKQAAGVAKELGVEFNAQALAAKGLSKFLEEVVIKSGATREQTARLFGDIGGLNAVFKLTGDGGAKLNELLENQAQRMGAARRATDIMSESLGHQIDRYEALKNAAVVSFGEAVTAGSSARGAITSINSALEQVTDTLQSEAWKRGIDDGIGGLVHVGGQALGVLANIGLGLKQLWNNDTSGKGWDNYPALKQLHELSEQLKVVRSASDALANADFNGPALAEMGLDADLGLGAGFGYEPRFGSAGLGSKPRPGLGNAGEGPVTKAKKTKESEAARRRREAQETQDAMGLDPTETNVAAIELKIAYQNLEHLAGVEKRKAAAEDEWQRARVERFRRGRRELEVAERQAETDRANAANQWIVDLQELGVGAVRAVADNFGTFFQEMGKSIGTGTLDIGALFGQFVGNTLVQLGMMVSGLGATAIAANLLSVIPFLQPLVGAPTVGAAAGAAALLAGGALIAAGTAIGAATAPAQISAPGAGGGRSQTRAPTSPASGIDGGFDSLSGLGRGGPVSNVFQVNFNGGIYGGDTRQVARDLRALLQNGESLIPRRRRAA